MRRYNRHFLPLRQPHSLQSHRTARHSMHRPLARHYIHPLLLPIHSTCGTSRLFPRKMGVCTSGIHDTE